MDVIKNVFMFSLRLLLKTLILLVTVSFILIKYFFLLAISFIGIIAFASNTTSPNRY